MELTNGGSVSKKKKHGFKNTWNAFWEENQGTTKTAKLKRILSEEHADMKSKGENLDVLMNTNWLRTKHTSNQKPQKSHKII